MSAKGLLTYREDLWSNKNVRRKILFTLGILALYRLLVFIPVPFADITKIFEATFSKGSGIEFFAMLLGGSLHNFSIIAVGLAPYINASIILQLLTAVLPHLEELQEQGEAGSMRIQQYVRWLTLPLAFFQSIGMVFFINYLLGGSVIDTGNIATVLLTAFTLTVGSLLLVWIGELITEKGISNGTSLLIFSSIVSGITSQVFTNVSAAGANLLSIVSFMLIIVLVLVILSVSLLKTIKEIPVVYSKRGKVEQTSKLPIPLNPVGMVPIIFAIALTTFPYLISQLVIKMGSENGTIMSIAKWVEINFNIYNQQPGLPVIIFYFILIIAFTYFYTFIAFSPERIADNIQKKGGFIPGMRPGKETIVYLRGILNHLCLWGGAGLGLIGTYSYIINYLPFINDITQSLGAIPVVVTGSGVIIIVGVVQDILNKVNAELVMRKYDKL